MLEPSPHRRAEIHELLGLDADALKARCGDRLVLCGDIEAVHRHLAEDMATILREQNARGEPTRFILPVGPTGQYPIFMDIVRREGLDLGNCRFFFMDEYALPGGNAAYPPSHPLSFQGQMERLWLHDAPLARDQWVFPGPGNIDRLAGMIDEAGGIDAAFGGVGIHGHLAFNEPANGVRDSDPRRVRLNDFTVTINAVRARVGGNLEGFPREAFTLGMRQLLGARRLRLAVRNGIDLDWANTVLRLVLLGEPGDDYPCTWATTHSDVIVYTDADTARPPEVIL